jgi:hypothetical protein
MSTTITDRADRLRVATSIVNAVVGHTYDVTMLDGVEVTGVHRGVSHLGLTATLIDLVYAPESLAHFRVAGRLYRLPYYMVARMVEA